ncbi:MAG: hypothetical protein ACRDZR_15790 [Acidimicrobiales bacterium]
MASELADLARPGAYRVHLDAKRRPTLPAQLLAQAGVAGERDLIAHVISPGRILLEDPALAFSELQEQVASQLDAAGQTVDALVESLFADRAADTSLG